MPAQAQQQDLAVRTEGQAQRVTPGRRARRMFVIDVHLSIVPCEWKSWVVARVTVDVASINNHLTARTFRKGASNS